MKKVYTKPIISVEMMELDQPISMNCTVNSDTIEGLLAIGVFTQDMSCIGGWLGTGDDGDGGKMDWNMDGEWDDVYDGVCYHSNIATAFLS